jgi:hypothetical protein
MLFALSFITSNFIATNAPAAPDALGLGNGQWAMGNGHDGALLEVGTTFNLLPFYGSLIADATAGDTVVGFSGPTINTGDIVLIVQMSGASAISGGQIPVLVHFSGVGQYEFRSVEAVSTSSFTFANPLEYSYTAVGSQILVVPQFSSITLVNGGTLSMKSWDGSTGGVGAAFVQGPIHMNYASSFQGQGAGYRGGQAGGESSNSDCIADLKTSANGGGAPKGDGITGTFGTSDIESAYGNYANGAGGGNCYGRGGGGGGNDGPGGDGGLHSSGSAGYEGRGGSPMVVIEQDTHALMGGGGGAGDRGYSTDSAGGNGGGLWLVRAGSLSNDDAGFTVAGASAGEGSTGGGGGGGAGGTIIAHIHGAMSCIGAGAGFVAAGGDGGNVSQNYGPGGGGGGGFISIRYLSGACTTDVSRGDSGLAGGTNSRGASHGSAGSESICIDTDMDGSCNSMDLCTGLDYTGDTDGDGLCDDIDPPPSAVPGLGAWGLVLTSLLMAGVAHRRIR